MGPERFDLDPDSRRALEFDELLDWLAGYARTGPGADHVRALQPSAAVDRIRAEQDAVAETRRCLVEQGRLVDRALADPGRALEQLRIEGVRLDPETLRDLAGFLLAVSRLRSALFTLEADTHPHLRRLGAALPDLGDEAEEILHCIEPDGRLSDDASPELRRIRRASASLGARLQQMLESYFRDPDSASMFQDQFITQRNGRFVIPVRTDSHRPLKGIVHASSSSGATQFVEPMETVELNNDLVRLHEQEQEEQERILLGWSEALRERHEEVARAVEGYATMDSLQARALFAEGCAATRPAVEEGCRLDLLRMRHPLLQRRLAEQGAGCVPLDLSLDPSDQVLVISGPNTGGKTVAIKSLGLAVLMAQSGIPVPGERVRLPLYRQLRADIGDHQSIEADLSTYSAHIRAVVAYLADAAAPALFLFDEIGGGTEPVEGAALAQSVLDALRRPGMTTVATTHQGALKAWAFTTEGAASAAMEFDTETLRPTFRILMGAAGVSAGLEIAERLGLDPRIVADARGRLGEGNRRSEDYLHRLRDLTAEAERLRDAAARREAELIEERRRLDARAGEERQKRRRGAEQALDRVIGEFRERARKDLSEIRDRRERKRAERETARLHQRMRLERERRLDEVAPGDAAGDDDGWRRPGKLSPGMEVYVHSLARQGRVERVRGDEVEVLLGRVPFTVKSSDLRVRRGAGPATPGSRREGAVRARVTSSGSPGGAGDPDGGGAPRELKLIGMTVDEALPVLDKFLDAAALAGHQELRVIHGHGTGRLRAAVREFLRDHPLVAGQRPGRPAEGSDGATVVTMR
jgi:DNA mismatch repair protein MutS2